MRRGIPPKQIRRPRVANGSLNRNESTYGTAMTALETHNREPIDGKTSRSIRDAVGERLQQYLKPHSMDRSPQLEHLIDELDRREQETRADARPQTSHAGFFR